ncbi:hypothetical protein Pmani_035851 [Petrolisthes manimaculis]|uniref:Uncharacterized protein n=1 Tax=Petrolisthes manimaculis TaxID=1843537 RepID=A0AAE1NJN5_9EUCA|nr:hypothetical protein Pmani_035851 [Petrolisthes manimaculis]
MDTPPLGEDIAVEGTTGDGRKERTKTSSKKEKIDRKLTKTGNSKQAGANVRGASREPSSDRAQKQARFRGPSCIVREMAAAEYIKDVAVRRRLEGFDVGSLVGQCNAERDVT